MFGLVKFTSHFTMSEQSERILSATHRRTRQAIPSVRFSAPNTGVPERSSDSFGGGSILRSSQSAPMNNVKEASFFRRFFSRQNSDYRADAASPGLRGTTPGETLQNQRATQSTTAAPLGSNAGTTSDDNDSTPKILQRCLNFVGTFVRPSSAMLEHMTRLINSRFWQVGLVIFTFVLLFGAQLQGLFIPKEGDIAFTILVTIALVVFLLDIIIRCYVEPQYFGFNFSGGNAEGHSAWGAFRLCSFMFWCDLFSTATLLYDISYINKGLIDMMTIEIEIDAFGLPVRIHFVTPFIASKPLLTRQRFCLTLDFWFGPSQSCLSGGTRIAAFCHHWTYCSCCSIHSSFDSC